MLQLNLVEPQRHLCSRLPANPAEDILTKYQILKNEVDAVIFSSCSVEQYSSSIISDMLGLSPKISHRIDNLCNSGTNAIVCAFSYISSGLCESALVVGAEKIDTAGHRLTWDVTRGEYGLPVHGLHFSPRRT